MFWSKVRQYTFIAMAFFVGFFLLAGVILAATPLVTTNHANSVGESSAMLHGAVVANGSYTKAWFEFGTSFIPSTAVGLQSVGDHAWAVDVSHPLRNLQSKTTYYFRLVAENSSGRNSGNVLSFTTGPASSSQGSTVAVSSPSPTPSTPASGGAPFIRTNQATNISQSSALIAGAANPNGELTSAWFEWGETRALGNSTSRHPMGNGVRFSDYSFILTSLKPGQTYFFRAMAENRFGKREGDTFGLDTARSQMVISPPSSPPPVSSPPAPAPRSAPVVTASAPVEKPKITLDISLDPEAPSAGGSANLLVILKNTSAVRVENVLVSVQLPEAVEFLGANVAAERADSREPRFSMGPLGPSGEEALSLKLKIKEGTADGEVLIFNVSASYRDSVGGEHLLDTFFVAKVKSIPEFAGAIFGRGFLLWLLPGAFFLLLLLILYRRVFKGGRK